MNIMAKLYKVNGEIVEVEPENGSDFSLEELKQVTDGLLEVVWLNNEEMMIIDEEGKLKDLPYNRKATEVFLKNHPTRNDFISGNALVCKHNQLK